jgi:hypothetical protein
MKGKLKLAAVAALVGAAAAFAACRADDTTAVSSAASNPSPSATQQPKPQPSAGSQAPAEEARRVTVDELKKMLDAGKAVVYDTRPKTAYDAEHVKGSLSMPSDQVAARADELPKDKTIVFYCT